MCTYPRSRENPNLSRTLQGRHLHPGSITMLPVNEARQTFHFNGLSSAYKRRGIKACLLSIKRCN